MSSTRWDPFGDLVSLREAMNNLLEESFVRGSGEGSKPGPGAAPAHGAPAGLAIDVRETPEAFAVTASVPGLKPEEIDINVLGDTLRISGERREEQNAESHATGTRWIIRERRLGAFERTVRLPATVRAADAEAEFKDGVLTVTLPKADEARPRSIPIRAGRAQAGQPQPIDGEGNGGSQPVPTSSGPS